MSTTKVIGWGKCTATHTPSGTGATAKVYDDIVDGSTSLSVEEGQEQEALIEGGQAEARKKQPDKYIIEFDRRIGNASDVTPGFTDDAGSIEIEPELVGAIGVTLTGVSLHQRKLRHHRRPEGALHLQDQGCHDWRSTYGHHVRSKGFLSYTFRPLRSKQRAFYTAE